jgi:hypothetical protein
MDTLGKDESEMTPIDTYTSLLKKHGLTQTKLHVFEFSRGDVTVRLTVGSARGITWESYYHDRPENSGRSITTLSRYLQSTFPTEVQE